jgi:RNA polymerase sigma-70 factor (ECF subfamily)
MYGDEDQCLVERFKNGDEKAFDEIFDKYERALYSICYRFTRNDADAREITQDVFIKVYRNLRKFSGRSKFFTWVYRIAVNTCISARRKEHHATAIEQGPAPSLDRNIRMKIAIDSAMAKLPERQRLAFILRHYEGYKYDEIGQIMGISSGAVKAHHHQAVKKLRVFLKDWV